MSFHRFNGDADRRRFPRIRLYHDVRGRLAGTTELIRLRDLSSGGFSVESRVPFDTGSVQQFHFNAADGRQITVTAVTRRCLGANPLSPEPRYVAGFSFVSRTATDRALIDAFVNGLMCDAPQPTGAA
jgi:hypothetical protein